MPAFADAITLAFIVAICCRLFRCRHFALFACSLRYAITTPLALTPRLPLDLLLVADYAMLSRRFSVTLMRFSCRAIATPWMPPAHIFRYADFRHFQPHCFSYGAAITLYYDAAFDISITSLLSFFFFTHAFAFISLFI